MQGSSVSSPIMRAELAAVQAGFDKLPALTGNAYKIIYINSGGSALDVVGGAGLLKLSTSAVPSIAVAETDYVTPNGAGALTNKTYNGMTISTSTGILTLTNGKTFSVLKTLILTGTDGTTMTFPATSASVARTDAAQTFTGDQTFSGSVGINVGPVSNVGAYIGHVALADASVHYGSYSLTTTSVARGGASDMGVVGQVVVNAGYSSSTGANAYGVYGQVTVNGSVTVSDSISAMEGRLTFNAAGATQNVYGARVAMTNSGGATVSGAAVGYSCPDIPSFGASAWAFLGDVTSAANKYNLYMRGTAGNYLNGSLGVGTVPVYYAKSAVIATLSDTTIETYGVYSAVSVTAGSGAYGRYGVGGVAATAAGWGNTGTVAGLLGVGTHAIAGTANAIRGVSGYISSTGGGSISEANVLYAANGGTSGGGTIASLRGFYSADLTAGTINTGFYSAVTAGANKWGVYTASANNYFGGPILRNQPTPTTETTTGTLLIAELLTQIITASGTSYTLTLDTGANCEAGITAWPTDGAIDWHVISTASGTVTIAAASGHTIVGTATVAAGASAHFRTRKTGTNTFVTYRLA